MSTMGRRIGGGPVDNRQCKLTIALPPPPCGTLSPDKLTGTQERDNTGGLQIDQNRRGWQRPRKKTEGKKKLPRKQKRDAGDDNHRPGLKVRDGQEDPDPAVRRIPAAEGRRERPVAAACLQGCGTGVTTQDPHPQAHKDPTGQPVLVGSASLCGRRRPEPPPPPPGSLPMAMSGETPEDSVLLPGATSSKTYHPLPLIKVHCSC